MSILIKGIEMPKSCGKCPMFYQRLWYCNLEHRTVDNDDERSDWCPLIEVKTPHGDLIDIDDTLNRLPEYYKKSDLEDVIGTAQIIIEAEE